MTNDIQQTPGTEQKPIPFGTRLKSAREAMGLERKDAAAQLRLNEKIIAMMEKDRYPSDLPTIFIRGYIRSYGKLLQIPEYEIKKAIEPIKPKLAPPSVTSPLTPSFFPVTIHHYFMQLFTGVIVLTLLGLLYIWWSTHGTSTTTESLQNTLALPQSSNPAAQTVSPVIAVPSHPSTTNKTITPPFAPSNDAAAKQNTTASSDDEDDTDTDADNPADSNQPEAANNAAD